MNSKIIFTVTILIIFTIPSAYAHELLSVNPDNNSKDKALLIPDFLESSWFTLEEMKPNEEHWYMFNGNKGDTIESIQIIVPQLEGLENFKPRMEILRMNEVIAETQFVDSEFFEPFSRTNWWVTSDLEVVLPEDSVYFIKIFEPNGDSGKFALGIGNEENFEFYDTFIGIPIALFQIMIFFEMLVNFIIIIGLMTAFILFAIGARKS